MHFRRLRIHKFVIRPVPVATEGYPYPTRDQKSYFKRLNIKTASQVPNEFRKKHNLDFIYGYVSRTRKPADTGTPVDPYCICLENKGRLQDCSCSIGSYHCIQCYAHILWAAPTGQTDLPLSHWVHFTVLRCICVFVFSCISLHACCIIVTRWGGTGWGLIWWLTILLRCFDTVGWVTWPVKISSPNDLYCVEWDVKPYSTQPCYCYTRGSFCFHL